MWPWSKKKREPSAEGDRTRQLPINTSRVQAANVLDSSTKKLKSRPQEASIRGPDDDNHSVRVFLSSTFLDMQRERDVLVRQTFPALRAKFRARGVELLEVDLRWGITREQAESGM
jgi:hypothetical protein